MKRLFISSFVVVIVSVLLIKFALTPVIDKVMKASMKTSIEKYNRDLAKGVYYLLQQELQKVPRANWKATVERLQTHFGYPLSLRDYRDAGLTEKQWKQLLTGEIVVVDYGERYWQRAGDSNSVIGMGPFSEISPSIPLSILIWSSIVASVAAVLLVWVFFFWRKLMKVSATTAEFGNGNFDVRVNISKRSSLAQLAGAFNSMADRIQGLIESHKELTNAVSHELRTPLARIRFGLEMLVTTPDKKGRETYAEGIQSDVDELDELVSELLTYARFDRETIDPNIKEHEVVSWFKGLAESLTSFPIRIQLHCSLHNNAVKACIDPKQMARAVGNLLQNAARYGNGTVRLALEQDGDYILIHVDDNGPGIPLKDRERIFEPFTRLDASRSKESGGFGLGLAIVKRIVNCHGGTVSVSDSDLGGSRFSIKWKAV